MVKAGSEQRDDLKTTPSDTQVMSPRFGRARIQDVAQAAGVSTSSVSNFLNDRHQKLGIETRRRIEGAIKDLDFKPNQAAQQLKTGRTNVVALLVPSVINPFIAGLVFAIEQAAFRSALGVHICNTRRNADIERRFLDTLKGNGIADLITVGPLLKSRMPHGVGEEGRSVVAIDASRADMGLPCVDTVNLDHEAAIAMAIGHLHGLGHRRIAYVTDPVITFSRAMRLLGFQKAMRQLGLDGEAVITVDREPDIADINMVEVGRFAATCVVALEPRPTALIAFNDMIALGLQTGLRAASLSVPNDLSIIGIDDIWAGQLSSPALTSVRQPIEAMADAAMERILSPRKPRIGAGSDITFQPELIIRQTTAVPRMT